MPPRKKARSGGSSSSEVVDYALLCGGHAEKPGTIAKFRSCSHCDVKLQPGDGGSPRNAHRVVLMSSSAYFEAAWSEKWNDLSTLSLPAVSGSALDHCLEFMYTGECRVEARLLPDVLNAAAYFQMVQLVAAVSGALQTRLDPSNCLAIWEMADRHNVPAVAAAAIKVAGQHFSDIASGPSWVAAPRAVVRALLDDDSVAAGEVEVYEACMRWMRGRSPPLDEEATLQVLASVRFARLPLDFVTGTVEAEPLLRSFAGRDLLAKAFRDRAYGVASAATRARALVLPTGLLAIAGDQTSPPNRAWSNGGPTRPRPTRPTCELFSLSSNSWQELVAPPEGVGTVGVKTARANQAVYVFGADNKMVWRFDPTMMTWSDAPPMSVARRAPGVAVIEDKIYVVGGGIGTYWGADCSAECFDVLTNEWETLGTMDVIRQSPAVATVAGKLYVMGGYGLSPHNSDDSDSSAPPWAATSSNDSDDAEKQISLDSAECFDPATGMWSPIARMPKAKYNASTAVLDGLIYVAGGCDSCDDDVSQTLRCMARYDPRSDSWETCKKMKHARWDPGMAALDGKIYVAGGNSGGGENVGRRVERYDPATNKWEHLPNMTEPRSMFSLIPI